MKSRWTIAGIAVLALLAAPLVAAIDLTSEERAFLAANPRIVVGGETDWPPMDFVEDGVYKGAAKDYLDEIERLLEIEFDIVTGYSWNELLALLRAKEIDMVPMIYFTEGRAREFNLTNPYITVRHYVFTRAGVSGVGSFTDLYGQTMAIPAGYAHIEYLSENHPDIEILEVPSIVDAMDAVLIGNADAIIENTASVAYYTGNLGIVGLAPAFPVRYEVDNVHMAVRSDWPMLRNILQKALEQISAESSTTILARWTGSEAAAKTFLTSKAEFTVAEQQFVRAQGRLSACINANRMPLEAYRNAQYEGMTSDYMTVVSDTLKVPFTVSVAGSWQELLAMFSAGKCDVITLAPDTGEESTQLIRVTPYVNDKIALATQIDEGFYEDLHDIPPSALGVVAGYTKADELRQQHAMHTFIEYGSLEHGLDAVANGDIFGVLDYVPTIGFAIREDYADKLKISGTFANGAVGFSLAIDKHKPLLASAVQKILQSMPEAQHFNIQRKWVAVSIEKEVDYSLLLQISALATVILLFMFFRYLELRKHRAEIQLKNSELKSINSQLEQQTDSAMHMAYHDQLTGLPNRAKLLADLDHAIKLAKRTRAPIALLFLDLDRFKYVNDTLGHDVGDELLKAVAGRIQTLLRETDTLCRLGGDEFIVLLEAISDAYSPCIVAQRIIEALGQPFQIREHTVNIGTSIGIAVCPDDTNDLNALIKYADSAMYSAKENGRNGYRYYQDELSQYASRRTEIETALRQSLKQQDFSLVFQPIVDLNARKVVKAEALIRWNHAELGTIPPDEFIPIAEEFGLICDIGDFVLEHTCIALRELQANGVELESIAVNVSSVEFLRGNIAERFESTTSKHNVRPDQIQIEITERYMLDQGRDSENSLADLRRLGHTICVDDFGTGYSSLSYMKRLPLNVIKIDRSFIQNIPFDQNDIEISQAIISLSHSLGYEVVAEGVETAEQFEFLLNRDCNFAQGYYFSRPVPVHEFKQQVQEINDKLIRDGGWTARIRALRA